MTEPRKAPHSFAPRPAGGPAAPDAGPQSLSAPTVVRRTVNVTVGIDFGTSSTKVFFRRSDELRPTPFVCLFEENPLGYPPIGLPSTVRVVNGKVYFAAEAERHSGGAVYRSFKTCLRCKLVKKHCSHCGEGPQRVGAGDRILPGGDDTVPPDELAAWYLAHVIAQINVRFRANYDNDVRLMYNMAAPMDVIQSTSGRTYYERAFFIAEKLAQTDAAHQGVRLESLRAQYQRLEIDSPELTSEGDRRTFVVAETRASMVAYSNSPRAVSGLYALIDIGAGTTDMSIFRYEAEKKLG